MFKIFNIPSVHFIQPARDVYQLEIFVCKNTCFFNANKFFLMQTKKSLLHCKIHIMRAASKNFQQNVNNYIFSSNFATDNLQHYEKIHSTDSLYIVNRSNRFNLLQKQPTFRKWKDSEQNGKFGFNSLFRQKGGTECAWRKCRISQQCRWHYRNKSSRFGKM